MNEQQNVIYLSNIFYKGTSTLSNCWNTKMRDQTLPANWSFSDFSTRSSVKRLIRRRSTSFFQLSMKSWSWKRVSRWSSLTTSSTCTTKGKKTVYILPIRVLIEFTLMNYDYICKWKQEVIINEWKRFLSSLTFIKN